MKKLLLILTLSTSCLLSSINADAQVASRILSTQAFPTGSDTVKTFMYVDNITTPINQMNRLRVGNFNDVTFLASTITRSLGFTPYNASNPAGYISSYTETDPLFNSKFAGKNTSDLSEGSNLYYTSSRFNTAFSGKSTTDLAEGTNQYFTNARARLSVSAGTGLGYNSGTGQFTNSSPDQVITLTPAGGLTISGTYPNFTITQYVPSVYTTTRALNSNFTISSTKQADVSYSISLSVTNPLLAGSSTATVFLEYSTNSGSTWTTLSQASNTSSVGVAVAVAITNIQTSVISGVVPANALVRLRSTTSGTGSATYVSTCETY